MTTIPPALADAYALLRDNVYQHLDEAEFLALKEDDWSAAEIDSVRRLFPDLLQVIRTLWHKHEPTWNGRCRCCLRPWPCATAQAIHHELKDPGREFARLYASST
jgi:hypothetical protein